MSPPKAGAKICWTSSADRAPPPPCPMTMRGVSRSGAGQVQPVTSRVGSGNGARLQFGGGDAESAVEVVGGAGPFTGDHGGAERGARGAGGAEGFALVRF